MQSDEEGQVYGAAQDDCQAATQETAGGASRPAAAYGLAYPAAGSVAQKRVARALPLLRGTSQWPLAHRVSRDGQTLLVSDAPPTKSAAPADLAADGRPRRTLAPYTAYLPSVSCATPVRYNPRQEPGAVVPHAGICAGGAG